MINFRERGGGSDLIVIMITFLNLSLPLLMAMTKQHKFFFVFFMYLIAHTLTKFETLINRSFLFVFAPIHMFLSFNLRHLPTLV